ncbi:hypothetical protein EB001_15525, partial [bacterium]|nr:hypothetical protein [bacterium]
AIANSYTNIVFGYSNTYTNTVGAAANGWANTLAVSSNAWANTVGINSTAIANSYTNTVFGYSNTYTNTVGAASNGWSNTIAVAGLAYTAANTSQYTANLAFDKANTGGVPISDVAPSNPAANSLWWSSDLGRLFVFYNDGSSAQWVEASPDTLASNQQLVSKINTALQNSTGAFAGTLTVTGGVNTNTISTSTNVASFGTALRILANGDIVISGNIIML